MLATISSPIIQYTLTRIAQFKPDAYKVSIDAITDCNAALDENLSFKKRYAAIERCIRAMDEYAAMTKLAKA